MNDLFGLAPFDATLRMLLVTAHYSDTNTACDFSKQKVIRKPKEICPAFAG